MAIALVNLPRIAANHPLVAYAGATTATERTAAIKRAEKVGLLGAADLRLTAAKDALAGKALGELPETDAFTMQVAALVDLAREEASLDALAAMGIPSWDALPAAWKAAYDRLAAAQEARVMACRLILMKEEPYYRHYMRALSVSPDPTVPTACVDTHFKIRYNPGFFAGLNLSQLGFVLLHEAEHVAFRHITRSAPLRPSFKEKDAKAWHALLNIAADLEILMRQMVAQQKNRTTGALLAADIADTLTAKNIKQNAYTFPAPWLLSRDYKIPEGMRVVLEKGFFEKFALDLFAVVCKTTEQERKAYDAGEALLQQLLGFAPADDKSGDIAEHDTRVARIHAEAENDKTAQGKGRGVGHGPEHAVAVPLRPTPFSAFVERLAGNSHAMRGTRPAWTRPAYYSYVTGTFEPARTRVKEPILFAFDTSGSISHPELTFAFNCLHGYALQNLFSDVHLMLWDSVVSRYEKLTTPPDLENQRISSGGTNMSCVAAYLDAHPEISRPKLTVYVTDGCVEPEPKMPGGRVLILCTQQATIAALEKALPQATVLWVDLGE